MNIHKLLRRPRRIPVTHRAGGGPPSLSALLAAAATIPLEPQGPPAPPAGRPDGLIAQYPTIGGEQVKVVERSGYYARAEPTETHAVCSGCGQSQTIEWGWSPWDHQAGQPQGDFDEGGKRSTPQAREWALEHAGECARIRTDEEGRRD